MSKNLIVQPGEIDLIDRIVAHRGAVSIHSRDVALRRPLGDVVEDTITAAAKSAHTARKYRRNIAEFVLLLESEHADLLGCPLVSRIERGKFGAVDWQYHTPAVVLLLVSAALIDRFRRARPDGVHAVKTFLSVAYRDNILTDDQARAMGLKPYHAKAKRSQKPVGRRLTPLEVQLLRGAVAIDSPIGKRDLAIVDTILYLGLRREELAGLHLNDFRRDRGRWAITFEGKGGKPRKLFIPNPLYESLDTWLTVCGQALGDETPAFCRIDKGDRITGQALGDETPAFCRIDKGDRITGQALTPHSISRLVAEYGRAAGIATMTGKGRLTPHDLRRTFARRANDLGASLAAIQLALGHASPETTAHYIGLGFDEAAGVTDLVNYG
jgi:integrase